MIYKQIIHFFSSYFLLRDFARILCIIFQENGIKMQFIYVVLLEEEFTGIEMTAILSEKMIDKQGERKI